MTSAAWGTAAVLCVVSILRNRIPGNCELRRQRQGKSKRIAGAAEGGAANEFQRVHGSGWRAQPAFPRVEGLRTPGVAGGRPAFPRQRGF